uniref:Uncharacterized protein n=1 Tax=Leptobrachium leishanense TaxID=445787 RepID=A0A8C5PDA6_9ANUR
MGLDMIDTITIMYAPDSLHLVSYNVRGLNTPEKRKKILRELWAQRASVVAFLQETHFKKDTAPAFKDRNFPTGYFSNFSDSISRGTEIVISKDVPFVKTGVSMDPEGRFLFFKGTMYTFASLNLPNKTQHRSLAAILHSFCVSRRHIGSSGRLQCSLRP